MKIEITPVNLNGEVLVPFSKSYSHRHLIASFLANSNYKSSYLISDDIHETLMVLKTLKDNKDQNEINLNFGKSASTLRFLMPILLLTNKTYVIKQSKELSKRPLSVYKELFKELIEIKNLNDNNEILIVKGPITNNFFEIEGHVSSQFISGLLFALPLLKYDSKIVFKTSLVSKNYVDMTIDVLRKYKIDIKIEENGYFIKGNQKYIPFEYEIESDFSQAAYWFVAGTINKSIKLIGLNNESLQGDKKIVEIINSAGGMIRYLNNNYYAHPSQTKSFKIDLKNIPDLGPILFVLAALSKGVSEFTNVDRLKIKESNRLSNMIEVLKTFGIKTIYKDNTLFVEGANKILGDIYLSSCDDHRILMAIFILATKASGKVIVENCEAVSKSYPNFFKDYRSLGGIINVFE